MKITGTKKLLIILLTLGCAATAGLGMLFSGVFSHAPKAYAHTEREILLDEEDILEEFSEMSGISAKDLKFYAASNGASVELLYRYYLSDKAVAEQEILSFLDGYSQGRLTNPVDVSDEDWYVAPDEVDNYTVYSNATYVGISDTISEFITSKSFITREEQYWRKSGFQWGHMARWGGNGGNVFTTAYEYNNPTLYGKYNDSFWIWDIAWLDEGEELEFGLRTTKYCGGKYKGSMPSDYFIDTYLSEKPSSYYDYDTGTTFTGYVQNNFSDKVDCAITPAADTDPANFEPTSLSVHGTRGEYKDEFSSIIVPNNLGDANSTGNTSFAVWTADSYGGGDGTAGLHKLKITKDAPSGVYYICLDNPVVSGLSKGAWTTGLNETTGPKGNLSTEHHSGNGWNGWSSWCERLHYAVMVCRKEVSKPTAEYGDGVSSDLTSKSVNYTGEPITFTLKDDWGPGMSTVKLEQWDKVTQTWVAATDLTMGARPTAGSGVKGSTKFVATLAGKYKITYTPFRNWKDGTRTPAEYNFEIKPMQLDPTKLVQEEGVDQATNTKYLYANKTDLFISLYPVPQKWVDYYTGVADAAGNVATYVKGSTSPTNPLVQYNYSDNGVLTLTERDQNVYKIQIRLKDPNIAWNDGTTDGSTDPLEFTFEIGPEKVVVPDIIQDTGQIDLFKKEVTYNGAYQTMSFMPINPYQLDITVQNTDTGDWLAEGIDYTVTDNTLTVRALDAAKYEIKLKVKPEYIFEELSTELTYELIIHQAEIDAPVLDEPTVTGTTKTVTYGGEKVTVGDDGTTQDWVATLSFKNADEARIKWIPTSANELGQQTWGDSKLVLSARSANTYTVKFEPQKNYKWKTGVNPPEYTLIIEKLKIAVPTLVNDGEAGAQFNNTTKQIGFDGNPHTFTLHFPTLAATASTPYTKKSSVFIVHTGSFTESWSDNGDDVTFSGTEANTYTFTVTPTNNYSWDDGTTSDKIFTFKIIPVSVPALHMWATGQYSDDLDQVFYAPETGFRQTLSFDGKPKQVRIGNVVPKDDSEKYVTSGDFEKYFFLLDVDGNIINRTDEGKEGMEAKLLDNMTASEEGGFLTVTAIDAGTYRIGVYIRNTNFWWKETSATLVVYTLVIEAQGITQPTIDESQSEGRDTAGHFKKEPVLGEYSMSGVYSGENFRLAALLDDKKFASYVKITDPKGNVYTYDPDKFDATAVSEMNEALSVKGGVYTYWNKGCINLYARDQGTYTWKFEISDTNYKWAGTDSLELSYTVTIARSPVSGIEMHFVGDEDEEVKNGTNGLLVGRANVRGSDPDANQIIFDDTIFSDKEKQLYFKRSEIGSIVKTGFSTQFEYSIKVFASKDGYDTSKMLPLDDHKIFDDNELRLFALDAGTYEISIVPSDNYCWNDTSNSTDAVMFTLVINKRVLERPVIINDDGTHADPSLGSKETVYNRDYQTFALYMDKFPQGYKVGEFRYYDKENRIGDDFADVKTEGTVTTDTGSLNLGVDVDTKAMSVQAKSAGEYTLFVVVENENNYEFKDGKDDLQYRYLIKKLKVELPSAYLSTQNLTEEEADEKEITKDDVAGFVPGLGQMFKAEELYTVSTEYNGKYHTVYFYGTDVAGGDFDFTVAGSTTNGMTELKEIKPKTPLEDNPAYNATDGTPEAGYYMLAALSVNAYTIKLEFTTKDFYWSTETADAKSTPREFKFIIRKNKIAVPRIDGADVNLPLVNDSYTAEFKYIHNYGLVVGDPGYTENGAQSQSIKLSNVLLGIDLDATNNAIAGRSDYSYSNLKVKVGSDASPDSVLITMTAPGTDGKGSILISTASLSGTQLVADGALVTKVYSIELELDPDNSEWDKGDVSANKFYYIKITKMEVDNPVLAIHDHNKPTQRTDVYSGEVFMSALDISHYDLQYMEYEATANLTTALADFTNIPNVTLSNNKTLYGETIVVDAAPMADTYTITVKLKSPDNMKWKDDGSSDDIDFDFIVEPVKVAKPYIQKATGDSSVVGLTKTVTFDLNGTSHKEQGLKIGNYWYNKTDNPDTTFVPSVADAIIPNVMHYSIANGTLVNNYPKYSVEPSFTIGNNTLATGAMLYNEFNNGWLEIVATEADRYIIRFKLTSNAVWADGSTDDVDVIFVIERKKVTDLKIVADPSAKIDGNTKTVSYKLSGNTPVTQTLDLDNFDNDLIAYDSLISGTASNNGGFDGNFVNVGASANVYKFTTVNSGEYEVAFKLKDGDNYRWTYADTDMAYFKLIVEKLVIDDPVIYKEYRLANEKIDDALRTLTVDYDLREHTILVQSLFENQLNGLYSANGAQYFTVTDTTATDYASYNASVHKSAANSYDNMSGVSKVDNLFQILGTAVKTPAYAYDGPNKGLAPAALENLFTLTAYRPGEYYLTFKLADANNMVWHNGGSPTVNDIQFKVIINKVQHASPKLATGEVNSKGYTGDDVTFKIANTFNGIVNEGDTTPTNTVSEKYAVTNYVGTDATVLANLSTPGYFEESWFNGTLTLKFKSIGVYTVRVSITDTDNISWTDWSTPYKDFILVITKRELSTDIKFSASSDAELNAKLEAGSTAWPISADVTASITIKGLTHLPNSAAADSVLGFKVYYENTTAAGTELEPLVMPGGPCIVNSNGDGTFNMMFVYSNIKHGKGNIAKGTYKLHIVQDNSVAGNYTLPDPNLTFTIEADPAPFEKSMLQWSYERSDLPGTKIPIVGKYDDPSQRFGSLTYEEGITYKFYLELNTKGMQGYQNFGLPYTNITDALNSWKVDWNGSYSGNRTPGSAGNDSVTVTITALDPNEYSFPSYNFTLYYTVKKALYNLSNLSWDYDGSTPFVFDGTQHAVSVPGLPDSAYPGLTILRYETTGSFISYAYGAPPTPTNVPMFTDNKIAYAGNYSTTVVFQVPANSNYERPVITDPDTYEGDFNWTRQWEITRQEIEVDWLTTSTSDSNGNEITKSKPAIEGTHANKFKFIHEWYDNVTDPGNPVWVLAPTIKREPGKILKYRATAYLDSTPLTPATDYARNYTFKIRGDINPLEYEVGGNDLIIINHIEVEGERKTQYEYTGNPMNAVNVIDLDISNGLFGTTDLYAEIKYYAASAPTVPLSGAPVEPGSYIVKLKLVFNHLSDEYALDEDTYSFEIIKAKFKSKDFEWHITHDDGENSFEAKLENGKWIDLATKEEVKIHYDGHAYEVKLTSDYASTVISFIFTENNKIDADSYTATATATIDTVHYEFDPSDPVPMTLNWEIEKFFLDLSKISWDYDDPYEFTLVNGVPKAFKAELKNVPEYLLDKIEYKVVSGTDPVVGDITSSGSYDTTATIKTADIDADNYDLGSWPVTVPTTLSWVIKRKEIAVPQNDLSWTEFDGVQHNLLKPFKLDVDYAEYFDVSVVYTDVLGNSSAYDGTASFGGKYYAYDAGTYTFTFKINKDFNTDDLKNIIWVVAGPPVTRTDNDQTVSYIVARKSLKVTGWNDNYESSTVILENGIDPSKFLEYEFYSGSTGNLGTKVELNDILDSGGGDVFSMVPVVKKAYQGNITLAFETGMDFTTFTTQSIDDQDAVKVNEKPYIYGYVVNGEFKRFSNEQLAAKETFVIYTGDTVEFKIFNWTYYEQYLTVWNGSLDDLVQSEAGEYTITLILRKDLEYPLYWGVKADNKIDRSAVELKFEIRYRMLTIPELPAEVTYTGSEINILEKATNSTLAALTQQYGDYVTVSGNKATNVGEQMLYLSIKDEYGTAIRWDNGTTQGLLGTYSVLWKINPILLVRPEKNSDVSVDYDGKEHSVYEFLKGYDADDMPQSIKDLMKHAKETNGRSINAGTFNAELALPNSNYSWCDASGNVLTDRSPVTVEWVINKKLIDFTKAYWGYMDGETPVAYDAEKPFVYTISNGAAQPYTIELLGMPEILKLYAKYTTNGAAGNSASAVDRYVTRVEFDLSLLDTNNYTVGNQLSSDKAEIEWEITAREFELPEYDDSWNVYDGDVHDLVKMLGLGDDWADYFEITVEYKDSEDASWSPYDGGDRAEVGFSVYKAYYHGFYKIVVKLKANDPVWIPGTNIVWAGGTAPEDFIIEVAKRDVEVTGWFEDNEFSYVIFKDGEVLPAGIAEKFEYVIYEDGDLDKTPVDPADVEGGVTYYMEFRVKSGSNSLGVPYAYGINLIFAEGVVNPYEFGNYDYVAEGQSLIWMPMPVLEKAALEYNGEKQTFVIKDFNTAYKLTDEQRIQLNSSFGLNLDASVKSFVYLQDASSLTVTAADEYTAVVRLLSKVYLSWYDSNIYETSPDHRTLYLKGTTTVVTDTTSIYNNKSFMLNFRVTPKKVPVLTDEDLEKLAGIIVKYDGTEKDVTVEAKEVFDELEAKYGKIFDYAGNKGTAADIYELVITLADDSSCTFYKPDTLKVEETKAVKIDGYKLIYVQEDGKLTVKFVKLDTNGDPVIDASGRYVEYLDGDYEADVKYLPKFETKYVPIVDGDKNLLNPDGTLNVDNNYFFNGGYHVVIDGQKVVYEYQKNSDGEYIKYYQSSPNVFVPESLPGNPGTHLLRMQLDVTNGDVKYGYKIPKTEDKKEYSYLFSKLTIDTDLKPIPAKDADNKPITQYLVFNGTDYQLRQFYLDTDGKLKIDEFFDPVSDPIENVCEFASSDNFSYVSGSFVSDTSGAYMYRYVLNPDGSRAQQPILDKDGDQYIIDQDNSVIKVKTYETVKDQQYKVKWKIDSSTLTIPEFDETLMQQYTGGKLYAKDVLKGFLPELMEITEGGEGVNAGEYTAKIVIKTPNSKWDPDITTENYVLVTWRIDTAKVDLSSIAWAYKDGSGTYTDSSSFVYTRKGGKPVVYWVELANVPEVLKSRIVYTTNEKQGAHAGVSAGRYKTYFTFDLDDNFDTVEIPETFATTVEWSIERRMLQVPDLTSVFMVFDSSNHNLLEVLGVPEDWNEYYDIDVKYSDGGEFVPFEGTDGEPYVASKSGEYMFTLTIKEGVNTSANNPNVVWLKKTAETKASEKDGEAAPAADETPVAPEAPESSTPYSRSRAVTEVKEETEATEVKDASLETSAKAEQSVGAVSAEHGVELSEEKSAIEQVCDRLKKLACGALVQLESFRKFSMRGTL